MATAALREDSVLTSLRELRSIEEGRRIREQAEASARAAALREAEERRAAAERERALAEQAATAAAIARAEAEAEQRARDERLRLHEIEARARAQVTVEAQRQAMIDAARAVALEQPAALAVPRRASRAPWLLALALSVGLGGLAVQRHLALGDERAALVSARQEHQVAVTSQARALERAAAELWASQRQLEQAQIDLATARTKLAELPIAPPSNVPTRPGRPGGRPGPTATSNVVKPPLTISEECKANPLCDD
jgi:hypothetical protein